jgi:glutamine amidotransferase
MIAIVDYKAGNLTSVLAALHHIGEEGVITSDRNTILAADRVLFPGVGAAGKAMENLNAAGLVPVLREVVARGTPFMGICLGYQILFDTSEENDNTPCLGLLKGRVVRFPDNLPGLGDRPLKVPHMGWNRTEFSGRHPLWEGVPPNSEFYYVHSYYVVPADQAQVAAVSDYGLGFAAGSVYKNLAGFQFHPEKSGRPGLRLLQNFCSWMP